MKQIPKVSDLVMDNRRTTPMLVSYLTATSWLRKLRALIAGGTKRAPVVVLYYHHVAPTRTAPNRVAPWTITPDELKTQVDWLGKHFDFVDMQEAQRRIAFGSSRPSVHLTFDDGYEDNNEWGIPWLLEREIPVTYYVSTGFVSTELSFPHDAERRLHLPANRLETLKQWQGSTIKFGGHTRSHLDLGRCIDVETLIDEIVVGSAELSVMLDEPIVDFAFPFGQPRHLHPWSFEICRQAGFRSVASAYGERNFRGSDSFHLRRFHGDPLLPRVKNWVTGDPREWFKSPYVVPEFSLPSGTIVPELDRVIEELKSGARCPRSLSPSMPSESEPLAIH